MQSPTGRSVVTDDDVLRTGFTEPLDSRLDRETLRIDAFTSVAVAETATFAAVVALGMLGLVVQVRLAGLDRVRVVLGTGCGRHLAAVAFSAFSHLSRSFLVLSYVAP
jgi:hypothetical protein